MHALKPIMICAVLLALPAPVHAMNWEGHDDWMVDIEPARVLAEDVPPARATPPEPCRSGPAAELVNPYEQIPLRRKGDCPQPAQRPKPER